MIGKLISKIKNLQKCVLCVVVLKMKIDQIKKLLNVLNVDTEIMQILMLQQI